jgi:hypothetical protein
MKVIGMNYKLLKKKQMKKRNILILLMAVTLSVPSAFAQDKASRRTEREDKFKETKRIFISNELKLTQSEADNFWPIYKKHEEEMKVLNEKRQEIRKKVRGKSVDEMTDVEAQEIVDNGILIREQKLALDKYLLAELKRVLPIKKVLIFSKAQRMFKRKLLSKMRGKRGKGKHKKGEKGQMNIPSEPIED